LNIGEAPSGVPDPSHRVLNTSVTSGYFQVALSQVISFSCGCLGESGLVATSRSRCPRSSLASPRSRAAFGYFQVAESKITLSQVIGVLLEGDGDQLTS
jgi:hypothetical protein